MFWGLFNSLQKKIEQILYLQRNSDRTYDQLKDGLRVLGGRCNVSWFQRLGTYR